MKASVFSSEIGPASAPETHCLVQSVAQAFQAEPTLEAVRIDHGDRSVSVATLGRGNSGEIESAVTRRIRQLQQPHEGPRCALLEGTADCLTCPTPLPPQIGQGITVQREGTATTIARATCPTAPKFWKWHLLPKIVPREVRLPDEEEHESEWKWQLLAAGLCGTFALAGHFISAGSGALACFILAYVAGAWFTMHEVGELLRKGHLDVHFLMLAVAAGSASIGAWREGALLLFLFSLSGALEHYAMGRTRREIRSLFREAPKTALLLDAQGHEVSWPVDQLQPGMRLLIKPGEQFPVDAEIVKGATASDESNLTGEATPVDKAIGDTVLAGTMNLWGAVEGLVLRPASQSALQRIIQLIKTAQHLKAPSQRFTDRFGTAYTYAVLSLSFVMFFVWWLVLGHQPFVSGAGKSAFYLAMTLLVVSSPCALVLSIPSAVLAAIAWSARRGILFRGGAAVENLADVSVVAMDKTGTLTTGELRVERIESFPSGREEEIAGLAYALERLSTHPLARAVTRYGKQRQLPIVSVSGVQSVPGFGVQGEVEGQLVRLGKREWLADTTQAAIIKAAPPTHAGFAEIWLARDGLAGRILLRDDLRPHARGVVEKLRQLGLRSVVLTGDRQATADQLKTQLAVDEVRAELKPEEKVAVIRSFVEQKKRVAMIGDGVNDAPSLAAADLGVAMGARGSDAALEQAEIVLMHDRLENFLTALQLSQRARRIIQQNLVISLGTVVVLVGCALLGWIPLTLGVVGHEGSTVIVVTNSLRLLFGRGR